MQQTEENPVPARPKVMLIATGGTIAGRSASSTDTTDYIPGQVSGKDLIDAIPEIADVARVEVRQFLNVASPDLTNVHLLDLARLVRGYAEDETVAGIVITHGTSTTEETALFLDLVIKTPKPVIVVGAMRPASAISADGSLNLLQAVALAISPSARHRGVMIVSNDRIGSALYTSKGHSQAVDAFRSYDAGYLGVFVGIQPRFFFAPAAVCGLPYFDLGGIAALPRVDILYSHQDEDPGYIDHAIASGARGIVVAGTGNSTVSKPMERRIDRAMAEGTPVVRASRTGAGFVSARSEGIAAGFYNPQKARMLLALAIQAGASIRTIETYFIPE
ncbi:asparaginase [Robbsia betulipollinis]|nr:asparaginase [Robbsia betulipollinis]